MELDLKKVQQLDSKQIYNSVLPIMNELYLSFEYMNLSNEDYEKIVLQEISNSKKTYKGNQDYIEYLKRKTKSHLSEMIKKMLSDPKMAFALLNNYITQNIVDISNDEDAIKCFQKLSSFLEKYNYLPNSDLLIELINKNDIFNEMVTTIFNKYSIQITSGKAEEQFDDNLLLSTIDTYCMLNSIEINESEDIDQDAYDVSELGSMDGLRMYIKEIGKKPLLSAEQKRDLVKRIAEGDSKARDLFIESNLKLVVNIAKKYIGRGLSFLDLIQEGNLGLMTAVNRYDISKGYEFSTYAFYWIKQAMTRAIAEKGRNLKISVGMYQRVGMYKKAVTNLEDKLGRSPTTKEVAQEMGITVSDVNLLRELQDDTISINTYIGEEENAELGDFIPSSDETPEDITIDGIWQSQVRKLFEKCKLDSREIGILTLRYGFNGNDPMTLEEVGKQYGLTRERVRQIEARALMKIRKSKHIKELAIYTANPEQSLQNIEEFKKRYKEAKTPYKTFLKDDGRVRKKTDGDKMTKEDRAKISDLLRTPSFNQLTDKLSFKEAVIVSLKLGYVDGKSFSTESIAEFLGMQQSEVIKLAKKALVTYKDNVNDSLNNSKKTDGVGKGKVLSKKKTSSPKSK